MKSVADLAAKLDDWFNPIAVKELRQAVQSKSIPGLLVIFLIGQLVVMGLLVMQNAEHGAVLDLGRRVFLPLFGILVGAGALLVPAYCSGRLMKERSGAEIDLLFVTALRPWSIVWGKLCSGLAITAMIFSAGLPFLVLTSLLRGIDIPTIFLLVFGGFLISAVAIQFSVFIGCIPASKVARSGLGVIGAILTIYVVGSVIAVTFELLLMGLGGSLMAGRFWLVLLPGLLLVLAVAGHFFVWSVALLSPRSANRLFPVRLFSSGAWLVTGIACLLCDMVDRNGVFLALWAYFGTSLFCLNLFVAVSEREQPGPRVARAIPRRGWRRGLAFLFFSGAGGGVTWSCLMLFLTTLVFVVTAPFPPHVIGLAVGVMTAMGAGAFAWTMTAMGIRKSLPPPFKPGHTWMLAASIGLLSSFLALAMGPYGYLALTIVWAVVAGAAGLPWLSLQVSGFRPDPEASPPALPAAGHGPSTLMAAVNEAPRATPGEGAKP